MPPVWSPVGIWTFHLDRQPAARARELAAELDALGYGALWLPEVMGRDPFVHAALLLGATQSLVVATGIANVYARDALAMGCAWRSLTEAFPDRFVLGLGVSHQVSVEGLRGHAYGPPVATMRAYLDALDAAPFAAVAPSTEPVRVLAALGPRMLELARDRARGTHPYFTTPEHTRRAREVVGSDRWVLPEQMVVLGTDADAARAVARKAMAPYLGLPNYVNNLRRLGFGEDDVSSRGSDRLVDAIVAWGDEEAVARRVREHLDAGADHVALQVLTASFDDPPLDAWRRLAPVLLAG